MPTPPTPTTLASRLPWRNDPAIARLTTEINELQTAACRRTADEVVAIGLRLRAANERLEHGEWLDWLATAVPFNVKSAGRYMKVATFATDDPDGYRRTRHLGPGKLYVLVRLTPARRRALPLGRPLPAPGNRRKTAELMTVEDLAAYLHEPVLPPARRPPLGKMVEDFSSQLADIGDAAGRLVVHAREIDAKVARKWLAKARAIVSTLEDAFEE